MSAKARVRKRRSDAKLTTAQVRALRDAYRAGMSVHELARRGWEVWGFRSVEAAIRSLYHALRIEGVVRRDYRQAARLRFGPPQVLESRLEWAMDLRCQAPVLNYPGRGRRCKRRIREGERYCAQHIPKRAKERRERMALVRAARV